MNNVRSVLIIAILSIFLVGTNGFAVPVSAFAAASSANPIQSASTDPDRCRLDSPDGKIQHVVYMQFDNLHFTRDNPNIPSDIEQMPHLLNFIEQNGTMLTNHHTSLISHTGSDILTSLTGLYGDRMGVPVSNSFRYYNLDGTTNPGVSFAYWTDPIFDPSTSRPTDKTYNMITEEGRNTPAPWVPFTRAGCDFGAVATANTVLENIATDIPTVFGSNSTQAAEVKANPDQAFADYVGIAVHCAIGSALCSKAGSGANPDLLPDEPGGYPNSKALYGHKNIAPQISENGNLTDLNGNVIMDNKGHKGFPGFDGMSASVSLSYVAAMQEHGVPVTYAYISDAHDAHPTGPAYGPGQVGYVATLASYDDAFAKFFARLQSKGIDKGNTLFIFTADEGDHFVGGSPSPQNCDGITIACTYNQIGEINTNMAGLLATQQGITTPFNVHSDSAPTVYINGNPARHDEVTRSFEQATGKLAAVNPLTGKTDMITAYLADPVEMKLLHMITSDPARTPTFTLFAEPSYFLFHGASNCSSPCVTENPAFAWNHGDVQPDITTTWLGMVGPGVATKGIDSITWSDHADIRPTMMVLLGLKDDYRHDGRALVEELEGSAIPKMAIASGNDINRDATSSTTTFLKLAKIYKQINAPLGPLSMASLKISTDALKSNSTDGDSTYANLENQLISFMEERNVLKDRMIVLLEDAEFDAKPIDQKEAHTLINQAQDLLRKVQSLAGPLSKVSLDINAVDQKKNDEVAGVWVTIRNETDNSLVKSGYSPLTFTVDPWTPYIITVANYDAKQFVRWQDDGSTNRNKVIDNLSSDLILSAIYNLGDSHRGFTPLTYTGIAGQPDLTIHSKTLEGNMTLHMWTAIDPKSTDASGKTTYDVYAASGYKDLIFDHWGDNGSTNRVRTLTIAEATTITAYYSKVASTPNKAEFLYKDCGLSSAGCGAGMLTNPDGTTTGPDIPYAFGLTVSKPAASPASGSWSAVIPGAAGPSGFFGTLNTLVFDGTSNFTTTGDYHEAVPSGGPSAGDVKATFSGQCGGTEIKFEATNGFKGTIEGTVVCTTV